ncbi:hypothetical protein [Fimbriimonas ginsengisoli]|uniref:Glycosidase like protein n=1 Tax=Fimbriimonas ginsengisoli Gsoil 348 TaxID=661478 RepID=A0A068NY91_FIMGI|nr:hypothetical protein [Fimbriimonas ginsengisoli]AIE87935.1 glycosidase like protein [Fimbriimonas ginsengisoli Gsoil 348]
MPFDLPFQRLFGGQPLISPTENWWESGVTFNTAAVYLPSTAENLPAIHALLGEGAEAKYPAGVVALHYRARPATDPGLPWTRSFVGVSVHEPDLTPIRRFAEPVLKPGGSECDYDHLGAEDPRITFLDDAWWMVYCGVMPVGQLSSTGAWLGSVSLAKSTDLVHWEKCGVAAFGNETISNKDGVLFPDRIDGKVMLLHRPMTGDIGTWGVNIATAAAPEGPYTDLGQVHRAMAVGGYLKSWSGAGSVPIKIGEGRYVSIEHTGNYLKGEQRKYVLDAFLYDFNRWDPGRPETLVAARMDDVMRPETDFEVNGPFPDSVANVVFACGSYVHDGWLYVVYGGGDSFILAARIRFQNLVDELEARVVA